MLQILKRNPLAVVIAIIMHIIIIAFLFVGVDWLEKPEQPKPGGAVVQARVVDQNKIDAEVEKLKQADKKKQAKADAARRKEEKRLSELKRMQEKEKKRLSELERKRKDREKSEKKRQADEKKQIVAEKKRQANQKKKKAEQEKKRKAEAKKRKETEAKRKAEAEKKRKAAAALAAEQKAREDALQARMNAERSAREREKYMVAIKQKVERNWLRPSTVGEGLKCTLRVRLMPDGGVAAVAIITSSGNGAFDRSVEQAVYKADPLPVPAGSGFEGFRDLELVFDPSK